ncbi:MAG: hypothetical protein U0704_18260, partial [Candidatus Eisenbacteria bacterium]
MWACSVSRIVRRAAALALALLVTGAMSAEARVRVHVNGPDSTRDDARVSIGPDGIQVTRAGDKAHISITTDSDSFGSGAILVDDGSGVVRFLSDVEVKPGERVDGDVVALGGNAKIAGEVTGSVVAVLGSVQLENTAKVGGDAVAVLGGFRSAGEVVGSAVAVFGNS